MGVLLTLLALGHPWPRTPGSRFRHPWLHRAPKALQLHPHPMSQPAARKVAIGGPREGPIWNQTGARFFAIANG